MRILFELSGDYPELGTWEIRALSDRAGGGRRVDGGRNWILWEFDQEVIDLSLLGMSQQAFCPLTSWITSLSGLLELVEKHPGVWGHPGSFVVRRTSYDAVDPDGPEDLVARVGAVFCEKGAHVDVKAPEHVLVIVSTASGHALTELVFSRDKKGIMSRHVKNRPFFSPVSLHPKLARAFLNIVHIPGHPIVDPFCGTGGFLLEAMAMKIWAYGVDIDPVMVKGSVRNLEHFGFHSENVMVGDARSLSELLPELKGRTDLIMDPPYGRSSFAAGKSIPALYEDSFRVFARFVGHDSHVGMILPDTRSMVLAGRYLTLVESTEVRVHGSLTRHFCLFSPR